MNAEQKTLKQLAEARSKVKHAMTHHGEHYSGQSIDCMAFRFTVDEAVKLGNKIASAEESRAAFEAWAADRSYRDRLDGCHGKMGWGYEDEEVQYQWEAWQAAIQKAI